MNLTFNERQFVDTMLRWSPIPGQCTEPEPIADGWDRVTALLDAEPVWTSA